MKDYALIIGFVGLTALPAVFAGLGAPAATPAVNGPAAESVDVGVGSPADRPSFSLSGAFCATSATSVATPRTDTADADEQAQLDEQEAERALAQAE